MREIWLIPRVNFSNLQNLIYDQFWAILARQPQNEIF